MRLIGINGFKTSGKDTVYKIVAAEQPGVVRAAFADRLKIAAARAIGYDYDDKKLIEIMDSCKETWVFEIIGEGLEAHFTGRQYLQWFGQGMRQVFGDSFWVDQVLPKPVSGYEGFHQEILEGTNEEHLAKKYPGASIVCVTDVRYANEAERVHDLEGEVWEVIRPGLESDGHSSEIPLDRELVDRVIDNDGTLEDLATKVREALYANAPSPA